MLEELQELRNKYSDTKLVFNITEDNFDESNSIYTEKYYLSHKK